MLNVIDLFSGCGGLSKGFIDAGYNVILGVDHDKAALETFKYNHQNAQGVQIDLSEKEAFTKIDELINQTKIDLIIAGPPCQGFSLSGSRNFDDDRNKLYLKVFDAVKHFKPKGFVIENVTGMATLYQGKIKEEILNRFDQLGYNVESQILCTADYGVPQMRKRLIFVGINKSIGKFQFPKPLLTRDQYVTCKQSLNDLPPLEDMLGDAIQEYHTKPNSEYQKYMRTNSTKVHNHIATNHTQIVKDVISLVPEGGNHKDLPQGVGEHRKFNEAWTRYHGDKPSKTIDTGHRNHFHYVYNRVPTVRENARLQSFRDDFIFFGTRTEQYKQVGNAVPPLLGYVLANAIKKVLGSEK